MSLEVDERRILIVPSSFIGVEPVDEMVVVGVADPEQIALISHEGLPNCTISGNSTGLFVQDTGVAGETNILADERALHRNSLSIPLRSCGLEGIFARREDG